MAKKRYTAEQIAILSKDPNIRDIRPNRLRFTLEFRQKIYDAVKNELAYSNIARYLHTQGYSRQLIGDKKISTLLNNFRNHGRPQNENRLVTSKMYHHDKADDAVLLKTGKFQASKNGHGIWFTDEFINDLHDSYPDQSIEDGIRAAGINPDIVGYQRIRILQRRFDGKEPKHSKSFYTDEQIQKYTGHPYVKRISRKQFVLEEVFYNEAFALSEMSIDDLMDLYHLDHNDFSTSFRNNLKHKISIWKKTDDKQTDHSMMTIQIQHARLAALEELLTGHLREDGSQFHSLCPSDKKELCCRIYFMPEDEERQYTRSWFLQAAGIPRTTFYEILRDDHYGEYAELKEEQDKKDIETIQKVIAYKGFGKGARQVYMDMNDIVHEQFGLKKIYRLMHKAGIRTDIRAKNISRRAAQALLKRNVKDNLVKRRFKLYGPNQLRLTDVTYIDFGNGKRAYGSAVKDPVTGKCVDFSLSSFNDLNLVMNSLEQIGRYSDVHSIILHSDQGALYLTDTFQHKVKEMGMKQSMSKRGNCWDNAPQESFFGHFKDEVDYSNCKTIEELRQLIEKYKDYYNNERHQWGLNKMTPSQYEQYLLHLTPKQEAERIQKETVKYEAMKKRAAEEAVAHAKNLGV